MIILFNGPCQLLVNPSEADLPQRIRLHVFDLRYCFFPSYVSVALARSSHNVCADE